MHAVIEELRLRALAGQAFVALSSWEENRVRRALAALAKSLDRPLFTWSLTSGLQGPDGPVAESFDPIRALHHIGKHQGPGMFLLLDLDSTLTEARVRRALRDIAPHLAGSGKLVILLSPQPEMHQDLEKLIDILDVPLPDSAERDALITSWASSSATELKPAVELLSQVAAGLTEDELVGALGRINAARIIEPDRAVGYLSGEKRKLIRKSRFLELIDDPIRFDDIGGLGALKRWLVERQKAFTPEARRFGLPEPKGLLLLGVQGCGKSLSAKAVADLWGIPLLRLDVGALMGSERGEQSFSRTTRIAEAMAPAVLWMDEIDKAFGSMAGADNARALRIFGSFITWLQEKTRPVFVIATANNVSNLPPELLRKGRFDEIFFVDLPDIHDRASIARIHLTKRGRDPDNYDTWTVAELTEKFSGAEIEQVVVDALFGAFSESRDINDDDLHQSVRDTVPLAVTMDRQIKDLRTWARDRTRPAAIDTRRVDFFARWSAVMDEADEMEGGT